MKVRGVSTIIKVAPVEIPSVKHNILMYKGLSLARQLKFLILLESLIGVSRIYLLQCNKVVQWLNYIYVPILTISSLFIVIQSPTTNPTHHALRDIVCAEYVLLVIIAMFMKRHKFIRFLQNLSTFDELLRISKDIHVLNTTNRMVYWTLGSLCYNVMEFIIFKLYIEPDDFNDRLFLFYYVLTLTHDLEQVFFFTLLRMIYTRIIIVRTHIGKIFCMDGKLTNPKKKLTKIESLSKNTILDIGSVHKVYELLHKCSDQLNTIMSIPLLILLFTSGFLTTALLKFMVTVIQIHEKLDSNTVVILIGYILVRCIKYTLLVIVPCYYTSITSSQVSTIRTTLHNAINTMPLDRLERRKVKAFYLLTKENEFTYALSGVIKLNMTLPLSYISLCTTYLVIIIQFSKFID